MRPFEVSPTRWTVSKVDRKCHRVASYQDTKSFFEVTLRLPGVLHSSWLSPWFLILPLLCTRNAHLHGLLRNQRLVARRQRAKKRYCRRMGIFRPTATPARSLDSRSTCRLQRMGIGLRYPS